jgi:hypothetical protein
MCYNLTAQNLIKKLNVSKEIETNHTRTKYKKGNLNNCNNTNNSNFMNINQNHH